MTNTRACLSVHEHLCASDPVTAPAKMLPRITLTVVMRVWSVRSREYSRDILRADARSESRAKRRKRKGKTLQDTASNLGVSASSGTSVTSALASSLRLVARHTPPRRWTGGRLCSPARMSCGATLSTEVNNSTPFVAQLASDTSSSEQLMSELEQAPEGWPLALGR